MIGLVSCSSQKLDRPAPARELYCSALFRKSLAYAEQRCERVGFTDEYQIAPEYDGKPLTKTAQIRMCGNSVCPPIAAAIVRAQFTEEGRCRLA